MTKIIGNPKKNNTKLKQIINKLEIDNTYIIRKKDFRDEIMLNIQSNMSILDVGKSMREKYKFIECKEKKTLDINIFEDYPDYQFDLSEKHDLEKTDLYDNFDLIICLAVLEHVYDPFKAIENLNKMLKINGKIFGYVPFLYHYHAPDNLDFQDYFRFTKDSIAYILRDFKNIKIYPVRGRISSSLHISLGSIWKNKFEKLYLNQFLDKFSSDKKNYSQCSGYNFIATK